MRPAFFHPCKQKEKSVNTTFCRLVLDTPMQSTIYNPFQNDQNYASRMYKLDKIAQGCYETSIKLLSERCQKYPRKATHKDRPTFYILQLCATQPQMY